MKSRLKTTQLFFMSSDYVFPSSRRPAIFASIALSVFIVYGSLFPFEFTQNPLPFKYLFSEWYPFRHMSDAIDNIVLFLPLGVALSFCARNSLSRFSLIVASWILLGFAVQVLQLYTPSRTASISDAINNAIGLILGLLLSLFLAPWIRRTQTSARAADPLGLLLVGFWYAYESFPFLPTLDVGLLAAHIKPGLQISQFEFLRFFRHFLSAFLGTSVLLSTQPLKSRFACILIALIVLLGSEILVPYGELRVEAILGIIVGMALGERLHHIMRLNLPWAVLTTGVVALALTIVTEFRGPVGSMQFTLTPFSQVLWMGATGTVPTAAFEALAVGSILWAGVIGRSPLGLRAWHWPATVLIGVLVFESLRVAMRTGSTDTSLLVTTLLLTPFAAALHRSSTREGIGRVTTRP